MVLELQPQASDAGLERVVNDFALMVATKNGSGSQTSNEVLIRSLFRMGIPVGAKNLFPSNIKGLPTWYTIRASRDGYIARRPVTEIAVTFNESTAAEDIQNLPAGGVCIIPAEWKWGQSRSDIIYYEVPVKETVTAASVPQEFRDRIANMVYVGVCAYLFGISMDVVRQALLDTFNGKEKPALMNYGVVERAFNWASQSLVKRDPFVFLPMDKTQGKILITGNEAAALGALFGGVSVVAWYPITPSTSLVDSVLDYRHVRRDPDTGKETVAVVQAEDELAAIGMLIGAGWAGARSMTSTSGPGISLMAEFTGLAYFAEIPCVIWDVTRVGPSTGLPTRTSQGDLLFLYVLSHGDTRQVVLLPGSVSECFEMGWKAHNLADQLQTPVFVMSDLDLGMNIWMSDPFVYPDQPIEHGKVLDRAALDEFITRFGEWARYKDYDGDGIPYRTVPGTDHPRAGYFTRGTGHTPQATYSERREDWVNNLERLRRKFDSARALVPQPVIDYDPARPVGIISYGSNDPAVQEARDLLAAAGIQTNYLRIRALPLTQDVYDFVQKHEHVYVVENNFDGQMFEILQMEISDNLQHMRKLALGDTLPMTAQWIVDRISKQEK
jgi:2-oxoglutarate ferredoxin oxidoreductase subunit alpha